MKPHWQKFSAWIDAMSLRERVLIFIMAAVALVVLVNMALLDRQFVRQQQLSQRIVAEQAQIAAIQADIQQKVRQHANDPDAALRQQLDHAKQQSAQLRGALQQTQQALVAPEKMPALLEAMLKRDGRLQLISMKTLPVSALGDTSGAASEKTGTASVEAPASVPSVAPSGPSAAEDVGTARIYRHGVEITIAGTYPDMLHYMTQLEAMPWQLYWGEARLQAESYPQALLTLTLFTLSLDKKWINL